MQRNRREWCARHGKGSAGWSLSRPPQVGGRVWRRVADRRGKPHGNRCTPSVQVPPSRTVAASATSTRSKQTKVANLLRSPRPPHASVGSPSGAVHCRPCQQTIAAIFQFLPRHLRLPCHNTNALNEGLGPGQVVFVATKTPRETHEHFPSYPSKTCHTCVLFRARPFGYVGQKPTAQAGCRACGVRGRIRHQIRCQR